MQPQRPPTKQMPALAARMQATKANREQRHADHNHVSAISGAGDTARVQMTSTADYEQAEHRGGQAAHRERYVLLYAPLQPDRQEARHYPGWVRLVEPQFMARAVLDFGRERLPGQSSLPRTGRNQ